MLLILGLMYIFGNISYRREKYFQKGSLKGARDRIKGLFRCLGAEADDESSTPHFILTPSEMRYVDPVNRFNLDPGQWTDDASMGLCLADSLLLSAAARSTGGHAGTFDGSDLRKRHLFETHKLFIM